MVDSKSFVVIVLSLIFTAWLAYKVGVMDGKSQLAQSYKVELHLDGPMVSGGCEIDMAALKPTIHFTDGVNPTRKEPHP